MIGSLGPRAYSDLVVAMIVLPLSVGIALMVTILVKPDLGLVAWLFLVGAVAAPVAIRLAQRRFDVFEPVVLASLVYFGIFVVPCGIMLFFGYTYPLLPSADLSGGAIVVGLGVLCFAAGYLLVVPHPLEWRRDRRTPAAQWAPRLLVWAIVSGLSAISLLTYVLFFFPSAGGLSQYLDPGAGFLTSVDTLRGAGVARAAILIGSVGFFIAVLHLLLHSSPRRSDVLLVFLSGTASVVTTALSKNRVFLLWDLAVPIVLLHYSRRPIRAAEAVLGTTVLFVIVVAFTVAIRSPAAFTSRTDNGLFADIADFLVVQTGEMSVVSDITQRQPVTLGYLNGATLAASAVNIVPRELWPEKPATAGEIYTRYFMPDVWRTGTTFLGVPWQGELLLNGGMTALVVGTFVSGMLCGVVYRRIWAASSALSIALRGLVAFSLYLLITRGSLQFDSFTLVWGVPLVLGTLAIVKYGVRRGNLRSPLDA